MAKSGVNIPDKAKPVDLPDDCRYLWGWFCDIYTTSDFSPSQIASYFELKRIKPMAWEVDALFAMKKAALLV